MIFEGRRRDTWKQLFIFGCENPQEAADIVVFARVTS